MLQANAGMTALFVHSLQRLPSLQATVISNAANMAATVRSCCQTLPARCTTHSTRWHSQQLTSSAGAAAVHDVISRLPFITCFHICWHLHLHCAHSAVTAPELHTPQQQLFQQPFDSPPDLAPQHPSTSHTTEWSGHLSI
jgi:hypothetical protein